MPKFVLVSCQYAAGKKGVFGGQFISGCETEVSVASIGLMGYLSNDVCGVFSDLWYYISRLGRNKGVTVAKSVSLWTIHISDVCEMRFGVPFLW